MRLASERGRGIALLGRCGPALAEERGRAKRGQQIAAAMVYERDRRVQLRQGSRALLPRQFARQRGLAAACGARVSLAQPPHARRAGMQRPRLTVERIARERVAHADVEIQIRQRGHAARVRLVAVYENRQPQAQLAQPHGCGVRVHPENSAGEHGAAHGHFAALVAVEQQEPRNALEHAHEKGAGPARRVQHCQMLEVVPQGARVLVHQTFARDAHLEPRACRVARQRFRERCAREPFHKTIRGEEGAGRLPVCVRHQALEGATQHFGVHGSLAPRRLVLARREPVSSEDLSEEHSIGFVGEAHVAPLAFNRGACEQPAVQEWHAAECARSGGAAARGCVERSEEQRKQHALLEAAAGLHAAVELPCEKSVIGVQPAFRLDECEKEEPRHVQERQFTHGLRVRGITGQRDALDAIVKQAVEAARQRLAPEDFDPPRVREQVAVARCRGERSQRLGIAVNHAQAITDERPHARRRRGAIPHHYRDRAGFALRGHDEPQHVRGSAGEARGCALQQRANTGSGRHLDEQCAQRARPAANSRLENIRVQRERGAQARVNGRGLGCASDEPRDRRQSFN